MKKNATKQTMVLGLIVFLVAVGLSGCTSNQNTGGTENNFIGTWTGDMQISMFGGMDNTSITELTFTENGVEAILTSDQGTLSMNYTYKIENNKLVLEPQFTGRGRSPGGQQPFNGTRPPWNDTQQPPNNGTWPPNGTRPPFNGSGQTPNGQQQSMSISFNYSFNEEYTVLYLDESQFIKVQ